MRLNPGCIAVIPQLIYDI